MAKHFISFLIGSLILIVGVVITITDLYQFEFVNTLPETNMVSREITIEQSIDNKEFRINRKWELINIIEDDNIEEDTIIIKIKYYDEYISLTSTVEEGIDYKKLNITYNYKENHTYPVRNTIATGLKNIKDRKIYNYSLLFRPHISIYINSNDKNNVKIIN